MRKIKEVLTAVYDNPELRKTVVPLFIGDPGLGKTVMIDQFAKSRGAKIVEFITSQRNPFEISGMAMPDRDTKKMSIWDFDEMSGLKDGDILFFDEVLNGNPTVLNACLTLLESRKMISGKMLPDIMIIAAANPQGMVPITPQIKERFVWYNVRFDKELWQNYMYKNHDLPYYVTESLASKISQEEFNGNNFFTPRSVTKAYTQYKLGCPTPYAPELEESMDVNILNRSFTREIKLNEHVTLKPSQRISYKDLLLGEKAIEKVKTSTRLSKNKSNLNFNIVFKGFTKGNKTKTKAMLKKILPHETQAFCDRIVDDSLDYVVMKDATNDKRLAKSKIDQLISVEALFKLDFKERDYYNLVLKGFGQNKKEVKYYLENSFGLTKTEMSKTKLEEGISIQKYNNFNLLNDDNSFLQSKGAIVEKYDLSSDEEYAREEKDKLYLKMLKEYYSGNVERPLIYIND